MSFDEWLCVIMYVLMVIAIIVVIMQFRGGKRSLAMTAGLILFMLGIALEGELPTLAPGLAKANDKASAIVALGLLVVIVTWLVERKRKA